MYHNIINSDSINHASLRVNIENNKVIHVSIHFANNCQTDLEKQDFVVSKKTIYTVIV